jgi:hypothetical protein
MPSKRIPNFRAWWILPGKEIAHVRWARASIALCGEGVGFSVVKVGGPQCADVKPEQRCYRCQMIDEYISLLESK